MNLQHVDDTVPHVLPRNSQEKLESQNKVMDTWPRIRFRELVLIPVAYPKPSKNPCASGLPGKTLAVLSTGHQRSPCAKLPQESSVSLNVCGIVEH